MIETTKIASLAQEFMAYLENEYPDGHIAHVGIVVEMRTEDNESSVATACSDDSRVYQTGLFQWALDNVQYAGEPGDDIPPPGEGL